MSRRIIKLTIFCLVIPLVVVLGVVIFNDRAYSWVYMCVAVLSCIPLFISFEKRKSNTTLLVLLAVMIALSVAGRFIFSFLPHFKPVTAMVVITGIYLGYECGFVCGAFTAVISNFIFGQGPWTPFQMFSWGVIGLIAGLISKYIIDNKILLLIYAGLSGILYSLLMDVWTTFWYDGTFNVLRFITNVATALPVTASYVVSNIIFLLVLIKPFGEKLKRIKTKYGI